jgi:hypothetical protein
VDGHRNPRARELADAVRAGVRGLQVRSAARPGLSAYTEKSLAALPWLLPA